MRVKTLTFVAMLLVVPHVSPLRATQGANPKTYRLVYSDIPRLEDPLQAAGYFVSVDRWLDLRVIRDLVCQVVHTERAQVYRSVVINIHLNLDSYDGVIAHFENGQLDSQQKKLGETAIAYYRWHIALPENKDRLLVIRDSKGAESMRADNFDHTKDCSGSR